MAFYLFSCCISFYNEPLHIKTEDHVDIYFYASHAIKDGIDPCFELEFEEATVTYTHNEHNRSIVATCSDGTIKSYGNPDHDYFAKLRVCVDAIKQGNQHILCGPEAATTHVQSIQALHQSARDIPTFPSTMVNFDNKYKLFWVEELNEALTECYAKWALPSDLNMSWSKRGKSIKVT